MGILHGKARGARQNPLGISEDVLYRWSGRMMSGESVTYQELEPLFEAARWAPSGRNRQEWRFYYALRGEDTFETLFDLLSENNKRWCAKAGALVILVSQKYDPVNQQTIRSHSLDTGMSYQNFAIEGTRRDLVVHPLGAFDRQAAEAYLDLGDHYQIEIMISVGKPNPEQVLEPDRQVSQRKEIDSFAFHLDE